MPTLVAGGGVAAGVVGRVVPGCVGVGRVLCDGVVEPAGDEGTADGTAAGGSTADGPVLGRDLPGGVAGPPGMLPPGRTVGELAVGSGEDCAAGEADAPDVTGARPADWAAVLAECPVRALTAA